MITTVDSADDDVEMWLTSRDSVKYVGVLSGERVSVNGGCIKTKEFGNPGVIWIFADLVDIGGNS